MNTRQGQIGFVKTLFPNGKVKIRQFPSADATSIDVAKSDDKVLILKTDHVANNRSLWYYVINHQSGLKGWIPAKNLFVLNEADLETFAKLDHTGKEGSINQNNRIESIQAFNKSRSLQLGINFMPKYYQKNSRL